MMDKYDNEGDVLVPCSVIMQPDLTFKKTFCVKELVTYCCKGRELWLHAVLHIKHSLYILLAFTAVEKQNNLDFSKKNQLPVSVNLASATGLQMDCAKTKYDDRYFWLWLQKKAVATFTQHPEIQALLLWCNFGNNYAITTNCCGR